MRTRKKKFYKNIFSITYGYLIQLGNEQLKLLLTWKKEFRVSLGN